MTLAMCRICGQRCEPSLLAHLKPSECITALKVALAKAYSDHSQTLYAYVYGE
jgi:hypothetical protein